VNVGECSISASHHTFHQHCIADHVDEQKYHIEQFNERKKAEEKKAKAAVKKAGGGGGGGGSTGGSGGGKGAKSGSSSAAAPPAGRKAKEPSFYTSCPVCYQPLTLTTVRGAAVKQVCCCPWTRWRVRGLVAQASL
jgi:hypothetical protein